VASAEGTQASDAVATYAVSTGADQRFRAVTINCAPLENSENVCLSREAQDILRVEEGDTVTCVRI
jgi:arginine N-succinyltransferase